MLKKYKYEYCVLDDLGSNIDCFEYSNIGYQKAEILAKETPKSRILKVTYDDNENEISCICVFENE